MSQIRKLGNMKSSKLRVSYTLLDLWRRGRIADCINYYQKIPNPTTPAMEYGKTFDDYINNYVIRFDTLPPELGGIELLHPKPQVKLEADLNDKWELVVVLDILEDRILHENKTGISKDSSDYANDYQVSIYLYMLKLKGIPVEKAYINHFNQWTKQYDRTLIWNSDREAERGKNFIETLAPEVENYFTQMGIINL